MVNTLLAKPINIKKNIFITLAVVSIMFGCSSDDSSISDTDVMKTSKEDGAVYIPKQKSIESTIESQNTKTTVQTKKSVEQPIAKPAPVKNNTTVPRQSNADSVPVVQTTTPVTSLNNSTTFACNRESIDDSSIDFAVLVDNKISITLGTSARSNGFQDLAVNFLPRSNPQISGTPTKYAAFNETKGFALHEYASESLSLDSTFHEIDIPVGKTPFQMGYKIELIATQNTGNSCSAIIFSYYDRPAVMFPVSNIVVPASMQPNLNTWNKYSNNMPISSAEAVILATHSGRWNNNVWEKNEDGVEKKLLNEVPMQVALYGDVSLEDYETIRDIMEVYKIIAPTREISFATDFDQVSVPIHLVDCGILINSEKEHCFVDRPSGAMSRPSFFVAQANDGSTFHQKLIGNYYGYINLSNQRINRHTLGHEFMHIMGANHTNCENNSMGPGWAQSPYLGPHDLMTIAAIHHPAVENGDGPEEMREALGIPNDSKWKSLLNNPSLACETPDNYWVNFSDDLMQQWLPTHELAESKL